MKGNANDPGGTHMTRASRWVIGTDLRWALLRRRQRAGSAEWEIELAHVGADKGSERAPPLRRGRALTLLVRAAGPCK